MASAMKQLWNKDSNDYQSSAKVVDGNLILSLPDAINPVVWRMELGSVKASALEVRGAEDGTFLLILKTPKGEVHEIAPFAARDMAVHALMRVSTALQNAEGKIAPAGTHNVQPASIPQEKSRTSRKWLIALGFVLLIIFLMAWGGSKVHVTDPNGNPEATLQTEPSDGETGAEAPNGVPMSADEMLKGF